MKILASIGSLLVLASLAGGCTSIPQPELDQANNGTALMMSLGKEISTYTTTQNAVMAARVDSAKDVLKTSAKFDGDAAFIAKVHQVVGNTDVDDLVKKLLELGATYATTKSAADAKIASLETTYKSLLTKLPDQADQITAARDTLSKMGEQLSKKDQMQLLVTFAKQIKSSYDDSKAALEKAQTAQAMNTDGAPK